MKSLKIIKLALLALVLVLSSCSTEEENTIETQQDLKEYLKSRNNNYVFHEENSEARFKTNLPEPKHFKSIEELDKFLNSVDEFKNELTTRQALTHIDDEGDGGNSEDGGYIKDTFYLGGFWVYMNVGFNEFNCEGSNLSSWISGFTLGLSYNHLGGAFTTYQDYSDLFYEVDGVMNYNLVVEGIGTLFSENLNFYGIYDCD